MKSAGFLLVATALLAVAGCSKHDEEGHSKSNSIVIDTDSDEKAGSTVNIDADSDTGKMALKLPGGFAANFTVPGGLPGKASFDVDGVGLYPGAKVSKIKVDASERNGAHDAVVVMGFTAPSDAAAVADWYQNQFEAKKVTVARSGETLTGKTEDGNDFTLALAPGDAGKALGTLTIRDTKKS